MYISTNNKKSIILSWKKDIITLEKNIKLTCIDVKITKNKDIKNTFSSGKFDYDIEKVDILYKQFNRIRSVKYDTFIQRVFGDSEVSKWEC